LELEKRASIEEPRSPTAEKLMSKVVNDALAKSGYDKNIGPDGWPLDRE
jgi:hypothetical protein